ncbi:GNAT family N-acetyltransferase [Candidatus Zixiibacteriota bacterium]
MKTDSKSGGSMSDNVIIRKFSNNDSLDELTDLLHRSYKILADMNLNYVATYQPVETTKKRINDGICFIIEIDKQLIGTATYYPPGIAHACQQFNLKETAWIGQMGILPECQKKGLGTKLFEYIEQMAAENNVKYIGLDTSEKAVHLIDWYKKLGYKFDRYIDWEVTNYRSVILIKKLYYGHITGAGPGGCPN